MKCIKHLIQKKNQSHTSALKKELGTFLKYFMRTQNQHKNQTKKQGEKKLHSIALHDANNKTMQE